MILTTKQSELDLYVLEVVGSKNKMLLRHNQELLLTRLVDRRKSNFLSSYLRLEKFRLRLVCRRFLSNEIERFPFAQCV